MEILTILAALVLIFVAYKLLMGLIKFAVIVAIAIGAIYLLSSGVV